MMDGLKIEKMRDGVMLINEKIYIEDNVSLDMLLKITEEGNEISHTVFTLRAMKRTYPETMGDMTDAELNIGSKTMVGNGDVQLELKRETEHLYSGRWVNCQVKYNHSPIQKAKQSTNKQKNVTIERKKIRKSK